MSPSATPAAQSGAAPWATNRAQARHQPNATSATPATQNEGGCHQVPRLPRKVARRPWRLSAPKRTTRASPMPQVPRLPRKTKVDVAKCHACHEAKVDVAKCHACHAKRRWMSPSATPATQSGAAPRATIRAQARHQSQVSFFCLDLKCCLWQHFGSVACSVACNARWMSPSATPATKRRWMSPSATRATRSEGGCRQVPRLARKVPLRHRRASAPKRATRASPVPQGPRLPRKRKVEVTKCHACHAKRR